MSKDDRLSSPEAAVLLLTWQDPTDRALSGWSPYPGLGPLTGDNLVHWLSERMRPTLSEDDDMRRLRGEGRGV
jgi:hypothetical protein